MVNCGSTVSDASVIWRLYVRAAYLCCSEEDVLADVSHGAGCHPQADAREDVGVVSLAGVEGPPIRQRDWVERAAAGEDASALKTHNISCFGCFIEALHVQNQNQNQTWIMIRNLQGFCFGVLRITNKGRKWIELASYTKFLGPGMLHLQMETRQV